MLNRALLLFDIDGTLLLSGGATTRCVLKAAQQVLGKECRIDSVTSGCLDPAIFAAVAKTCGEREPSVYLQEYKAVYLNLLQEELSSAPDRVNLLRGVGRLIENLHRREDVVLGLLTGNFREGAVIKLRAAGLHRSYFKVGVFAEDGAERRDLLPAALAQAGDLTGQVWYAGQVIVIGDTPQDIACARDNGAKVLAVATGRYSVRELLNHSPDACVADLQRIEPLEQLIHACCREVVGQAGSGV